MSYIGNEPIVSATRTITEITATAGQTVFVANGGYTVGYIDVFVNGAQLQTSDFTATNGSSITLITGASIGDDIRLVAWGTFQTANAQPLSTELTAIAAAGNTMFKNRIINGAMMIDQRNAGASVTPTVSVYTLDRWYYILSQPSKFSVQQNAGSVTPPVGFTNYLGATSLSAFSVGSGEFFTIAQYIEGLNVADLGWGTANASPVSLSFWVRSSLTGTFGGSIRNSTATRSYPFSYTISSANTWEYKTVAIPGETTGTWLTTNGTGIQLFFSLGSGTALSGTAGAWAGSNLLSATGATSVVGTNGATFYITGVQLEKGSTATSFDYRPYGTELALCQRYYRKGKARMWAAVFETTTGILVSTSFGVTMRVAPTIIRLTNSVWGNVGGDNTNTTGYNFAQSSVDGASIAVATDVSRSVGLPATCVTNDFVEFTAEL